MCIQWCCKNCLDKLTGLTHQWAYERCNDFFIARSREDYLTECPNGPWQMRRAFHRHPYRGPQMCDSCRNVSRKEKKLLQSAREKANVALGHPPEYTGAIDLGELESPEIFQEDTQLPLEPGEVDSMKDKGESSSTFERNETPPQSARPFLQYSPESTTEVPNSTIAGRETSLITNQHIQRKHDISQDRETETDTDKREVTPVEEAQSRAPNHQQQQLPSHTYSGMTNTNNRVANVEEQDFSRNPDRSKFSYPSRTTTRASPSQPTRTRPWDL